MLMQTRIGRFVSFATATASSHVRCHVRSAGFAHPSASAEGHIPSRAARHSGLPRGNPLPGGLAGPWGAGGGGGGGDGAGTGLGAGTGVGAGTGAGGGGAGGFGGS